MTSVKLLPIQHQNKTQAIRSSLMELANSLGPEARLPTMLELRDSLGVSVVTLNRALSELEAQGVISRRHGVGIFVASQLGQKTIGLVFDRSMLGLNASQFWDMLISKARDRASSHNEKFSLFLAMGSHNEALQIPHDLKNAVTQGRLHGIIFVGPDQAAVQWLEQQLPLVAYANIHASHYVSNDGAEMVRLGTQSLVKQGCRRIGLWIPTGLWVGPDQPGESYAHMDVFRKALKSAGLPFHPEWVKEDYSRVPIPEKNAAGLPPKAVEAASERSGVASFEEQGYYVALNTFGGKNARHARPDGVVVINDLMTRGVIAALSKLNLKLGTDIKIATHANKDSTTFLGYEDDLTRVEVDVAEIVNTMYEMLETRIAGGELPLQRVFLKPHLRSL
jgi:DNA-binding LacI/PurR family transcriptional regulator